MAIRPIIEVPDKRLKTVSQPVAKVTDDTRALMDDMLETMYDANGIGLAAIQVGVADRVIVMDISRREEWHGASEDDGEEAALEEIAGETGPRFFVNPEIVWASEETRNYQRAACLSPVFMMMSSVPPNAASPMWIMTARRRNWNATACWQPAFNTRWIIWKALFSSTGCRG